jgi:DNA (cytosine-5)-methyltransferase 1
VDLVDLFCGGGAASIGAKQAGLNPVLGIDNNPQCVLSYALNNRCGLAEADLTDPEAVSKTLSEYGIKPSFDGVFWVSAPCQGFSSANSCRSAEDSRNSIMLWIVPFIAERFSRATIIVENVPSMMDRPFENIRTALYKAIFKVRRSILDDGILSDSVHCASDFGVPQTRRRLVFSVPPKGKHVKAFHAGQVRPRKTIKDAIGPDFVDQDPEFVPLTPIETLLFSAIPAGGNWKDSGYGTIFAKKKFGESPVPDSFLKRPSWKDLSPCLLASPWMRFKSMCPIHPNKLRRFTIGEMKSLQGMPQNHILTGDVLERHRMVGNGVPPPMSKAAIEFFLK